MNKKNGNNFQGTVLTHLEYIRRKQDEHDKKIECIIKEDIIHKAETNKQFNRINKRVDTAEGFAKGAIMAGTLGVVGGLFSFIKNFGR